MTDDLQIDYWQLDRLVPYARNPRKNDEHVDRMAGAIQEFGFRIPIVAKSDGTIVDGHLRLKAARKLGMKTVPVVLADELTDAQIKAFRILANKSVEWAQWDEDLLRLELDELRELGVELGLTGFDDDELADIFTSTGTVGLTDPDEIPEVPEEPVTKPGDLYVIGNHRLLCGDSTDAGAVALLMDGSKADMVFTDPPYNVDYGNTMKDSLRKNKRTILNDNLGQGFGEFMEKVCTNLVAVTTGAIYIAMSSSELHTLRGAFSKAGGHWSTFIIWAKNTFTLGRADYQRQYEPILYGWPEGNTRHWCGARDQGDVWLINKPVKNDLHPTMKPIELVERAIVNSSKAGGIVLDLFGGSGSTMIACEASGRKCRMMELDPKYCDVIVKRWEAFTGKQAAMNPTDMAIALDVVR